MQIIAIILIVFGAAGLVASLYALFNIKSPILTTEDGNKVRIAALSFQTILNIIFIYLTVLHLMFVLIGVGFLIA